MSARDDLRAEQRQPRQVGETDGVMFDPKGKLILPQIPAAEDNACLCRWLTVVFNLDATHPITGGVRQGLRGPDCHVELARAGAQPIRFEPATRINNPSRLIETLSWQMLPSDGAIHALKADHSRDIAHVVRMLCGLHDAMTEAQEADGIIGTFMAEAVVIEGLTTYGTAGQRYEAAVGLRREIDPVTGRQVGPHRYLIDSNTGELVTGVSDMQDAARRHVGSSLPRGWLDARMTALGWARITLAGYGQAGRAGRKSPHARINAYRGHLHPIDHDNSEVNT